MRDIEKMLQGLGEENKKAEQEKSAMTLKNAGYKNAKGKFVIVKKGRWNLNWTFHTEAA
ncbi:unknown [Roseburia sp. CAG:309]|nr:unknown [Roseburia sp. CAG:309]